MDAEPEVSAGVVIDVRVPHSQVIDGSVVGRGRRRYCVSGS